MRWLWLAPLVLLTACVPMEYHVDYDRRADFSTYKTFAWTSHIPARQWERAQRENLMVRRVVERVEAALLARGFRKAPDAKGDVLVAFTPLSRDRAYTTGFHHYGWTTMETRRVREAGLQIDLLDGASRKLVWTGIAGGGFTFHGTPEDVERQIGEAVQELMGRFPPRP